MMHLPPGLAQVVQAATAARYRALQESGCQMVPDWYGTGQLAEILGRFGQAVQAQGRFFILDAPPGLLANSAGGWNAESLADGTLLFNYDLLNASWAVAAGYARRQADPSFDLGEHLAGIAQTLDLRGKMMPAADPYGRLVSQTAWIFRDMTAFVAAHELAHFVKHHLAFMLAQAFQGGPADRGALLSQEQEHEADLFGLDTLVRTWAYNPLGAVLSLSFMAYLDQRNGEPGEHDSHPPARKRLAVVQRWLVQRGLPFQV
jgi:hypothetical protein